MKVRKIFHLSIPVANLDAAREFYERALGARVGRIESDWLDILLWGHQITLQLRPDEVTRTQGKRHFGTILSWTEWQTLAEHLETAGIPFAKEPEVLNKSRQDEQAKFYLEDPSHNVIEIKAYRDVAAVFGTEDPSFRAHAAQQVASADRSSTRRNRS